MAKLPAAYERFQRTYRRVWEACERLGETAGTAFYRSLARLLRLFVRREIQALDVEPLKFQGGYTPSERAACTCPFSGRGAD